MTTLYNKTVTYSGTGRRKSAIARVRLIPGSGKLIINGNTEGGGLTGQANAIRLGVARALCNINPDNREMLKSEGYLTRDARIKERRKYGLRKARKAPQYSKR